MSRIFGKINQNGYVVSDIEAAMDAWVAHGVGPWFYFENIETDYFRHRGAVWRRGTAGSMSPRICHPSSEQELLTRRGLRNTSRP